METFKATHKKIWMAVCIFGMVLAAACGSDAPSGASGKSKGCLENMPEKISGLKVTGARTEANVIRNMWPVVCQARALYRKRLNAHPGLKGTLYLKLSVEFNGEIGPHSITRSTLSDKEFERTLLSLLQFMDFDPYGPQNTESEIVLPIRFKP